MLKRLIFESKCNFVTAVLATLVL